MNAVFYPAVFHPEEMGYSVTVPDIEGCFTQGDTMMRLCGWHRMPSA